MSKRDIVVKGGRRLIIQKSKTSDYAAHVELLGADRQSLATFSIDCADIGIVMLALEGVAQSIERGRETQGLKDVDHAVACGELMRRCDEMRREINQSLTLIGEVS